MKLASIFTLLIVLLWISTSSYAQPVNPIIGDVTMPAPNAAALGKYGDIPVSYYTGVPNIGIPIHTVQQGPLSLPISLSYHASGIKVGELASWVGLGWSLNAGGMITRMVQGLPDDKTGGYYHSASTLDIEDPNDLLAITEGSLDSEPDIFFFNFAGYSGKFYFDADQNIQLVPLQDIEIEVIVDNSLFTTFIFTDTKGIRYIFGKDPGSTQSAIETSRSSGQSSPDNSTWYLIRMESFDGHHAITLTYDSDHFGYRTLATCRRIGKNCLQPDGQTFTFGNECTSDAYELGFPNNRYTTTNIDGWRLAKIATTTDTVEFHSNTTRLDLDDNQDVASDKKRLDVIEIRSGGFCKEFTFSFDYFEDSAHSSVSEGKRLRLEALQESNCTGTDTIPSYHFEYEGDDSFPFRLSKATDHWGYYNGASGNNSQEVAIPFTTVYPPSYPPSYVPDTYGSADKETDSIHVKKGVLNKITYPTGGFTEFTFEANEVAAVVNDTTVTDIFDLQESSPFDDDFCGQVIQTDTFRFATQGQIDSSLMRLHMVSVKTGNCTAPIYQQYSIEVLLGGSPIGSISFDTMGMADSIVLHQDLNTLANFEVDSLYTFRLTTNETWGRFQIEYTGIIGMPATKKVGGVRIKKTRSHDGISTDNDIIREYDYSFASSPGSSGQLTSMPVYGQFLSGTHIVDDGNGGDATQVNMVVFNEHSVVPISSFQGYHVAYRSVTEIFKDGSGNAGYTNYKYRVDLDQGAFESDFPYVPHQIQLKNGHIQEQVSYDSTDTVVSQIVNGDLNGTFSTPGQDLVYKVAELGSCPPGSGQLLSKFVFISGYTIKTGAYLVTSSAVTRDGVTEVITFDYENNPALTHLMPMEIVTINSDGKETHREFLFPTDSVGTAVYDSMIVRNLLTPISEQIYIAQGFVEEMFDGTFTEYQLFAGEPYPAAIQRFEGTWTNGGLSFSGNWVPQVSMANYVNGYPTLVTKTGWSTDTLTWTASGQIDLRKFEGYSWDYDYHTGTRMLSKMTDIDGQFIEYDYDDLMRLSEVRARQDNVVTSYDYIYQSPSIGYNYVKSTIDFHQESGSGLDERITVEYLDGLGRPLQTVEQAYSPAQLDIIKAIKYDKLGRVAVTYEPFESGVATGAYVPNIPGNVDSTLVKYEASPLNRPLSITPPSWHTTFMEYGTNTSSISVPGGANYTSGVLYKETVIEPDGSEGTSGDRTITYTDRKGRLILSQRQQGTSGSTADTYYLYDDKDRVTMVIPPGADETSDDLTYRYAYTGDDLILSKKLPGQDSLMQFRYDARDLLTYTKDGNLGGLGLWLHTHYDDYGRPTGTGFYEATTIADGNTSSSFDEQLSIYTYGDTGIETGRILTSNHRILGTGDYLFNGYGYDAYGRIANIYANNHLNSSPTGDVTIYDYDFADNVLSEERTHRTYYDTLQIDQRWIFDHSGRNTAHYLEIDNAGEEQLCELDYTIKDELKQKQLGYTGSGFLQTVDYSYLENGFLHKINAIDTAGTGSGSNDLFHLELRYDQDLPALNQQFNGNIGQVLWQVKGSTAKLYKLEYDYLNRLTYGNYKEFINGVEDPTAFTNYLTSYTYDDARGNFETVSRTGVVNSLTSPAFIDILDYTYYPGTNRLKSIEDSAPVQAGKVLGFYPGDETGDYQYDKNGNLTHDPYKELQLSYNHLNLPDTLTHNSNGGIVTWLYDSGGQKLQKKNEASTLTLTGDIPSGLYQAEEITADGEINGNGKVELEAVDSIVLTPGFTIEAGAEFRAFISSAANLTHDYVGNIEYVNGKLDAIYLEEGRVNYTANGSRFEYTLTDHLGNTRVTFADLDDDGQVDESGILDEVHMYPFGMQMDGPWSDFSSEKNAYSFNQIERNGDLAINLDLAEFRGYDAAIGRWMQVDPIAEVAPGWMPYRFAFNNPLRYLDPLGLFESRAEAKAYRDNNELRGRIRKNKRTGQYEIRLKGSDGRISRNSDGEIKYAAVAARGGSPRYSRAPKPGTWESDVYTSVIDENNKFVWIYRGSGEDYIPPINAAEAVGRMGAIGMLKGGGSVIHHLASNKHLSKYTPLFEQIANKYGLRLNQKWNKLKVSTKYHYSKHPNEYHEFVLRGMKAADAGAAGDKAKFLELFDKFIRQEVINNPNILNKKGW